MASRLVRLTCSLLVAAAVACGAEPTAPTSDSTDSCQSWWTISGGKTTLMVGETVVWQASLYSRCLIGGGWTTPVHWRADDPAIVALSGESCACCGEGCEKVRITGRAPGVTIITARKSQTNIEQSVQITVVPMPAAAGR